MGDFMNWRVLGPVEAAIGGQPLPVSRPQHRAVLAYLLLNANVVVPAEQLAEALWGGNPPTRARTQIQVCVSRLRQAGAADLLASTAGGYRLTVSSSELDIDVFNTLTAQARHAPPAQAVELLNQALALWRGPALAGASGAFVTAAAANLHGQKLSAHEDLFDAEFALGRHAAAAAPLRELLAENPWRERLAAQLMTALARSGQQAEALRVYEQTRRRLAEDLGVQPGAQLAETQLLVLRQQVHSPRPVQPGGPAQLPADLSTFTGRGETLSTLDAMLGRATPVVAIVGTAGVGKTALAIKWAHQLRQRYTDGQLFADLRGFSPAQPLTALEALSRFLRALGVPASRVPADIEEAAGLYRSMLADRRVLILLDNARDTAQIKPLLPGGPGCLVIVTSRARLDGLIASHDAQRLSLDVLAPGEASQLLTKVIGPGRLTGQQQAATELAQACAHLPLALRIAAADLHNRPHQTISGYVAQLREGDPLTILTVGEDAQIAVRHAFTVSYQALPADVRRLFRLFGLIPGSDVTADSAAVMLHCPPSAAANLLSSLASAHLIHERASGRFTTHDLLSLYAAQLATDRSPLADLLSWYLDTASAAAERLCPQVLRLPTATSHTFDSHVHARSWLDGYLPNLVSAIRHGAQQRQHTFVWALADALRGYLWLGMHTTAWTEVAHLGLAAAQADRNRQAEAAAHLSLGALNWRLEHFDAAIADYQRAVACARDASWPEGQAAALGNLGPVYRMQGRPQHALDTLGEALTLNRRTGRVAGVAVNHNNLGLVCLDLGRLTEAAAHCQAALALARQAKSVPSQALALTNLGDVYHLLGRCDEAFQTLAEALRLHEQTGSRGRAATLCTLARIHADRGDRPQATRLAQQALTMAHDPPEPRLEAMARHTLGIIGTNAEVLKQALACARTAGDRYIEADIAVSLGTPSWCRTALSIAENCGYRVLQGRAHTALATAHYLSGDMRNALVSAQLALDLHTATGHQPGLEQTEKLLARLSA